MTRPARVGTRIGILGGTLDPIHLGHLDAAIAARDAFGLAQVLVLPARVPPHRAVQPAASAFHRFAMSALAVTGIERLAASDDELSAPGPSFTADTLERLQASGYDRSQIFFISGADAFAEIATWRRYPDVLDLAHFVVLSRPGHRLVELRDRLPALASRMRSDAGTASAAQEPAIFLLDAPTPDVSSTAIRARLWRGDSITGLVPPLVETHILQHGLYSAAAAANQLHGKN